MIALPPWDEPLRGRAAIVADWVANQDPPGSWEAGYEPLVVSGDAAVATGRSRYFQADGALAREYWNCYVLRFDGDGRCREFTEWYMKRMVSEVEAATGTAADATGQG